MYLSEILLMLMLSLLLAGPATLGPGSGDTAQMAPMDDTSPPPPPPGER